MIKKIIFCDPNEALCQAFKKELSSHNLSNLKVKIDINPIPFQDVLYFDAIVAAGNSFGVMSGGIDLYIRRFFNNELKKQNTTPLTQERVQQAIKEEVFGELPVGSSLVIDTGLKHYPYIVYAPTMRTPVILGDQSNNAYYSTLSAMISIIKHNQQTQKPPIETVIFSGMGTGTGGIPYDVAAKQQINAWLQALKPLSEKDMNLFNESYNTEKFLNHKSNLFI